MRKRYASGGASDEAGGEYRRGVAALFAAYGLNGVEYRGLPLAGSGVVERVALETDDPIDDIVVGFSSGRLFIQAKRSLNLGRPLREAAAQWLAAVRDDDFDRDQDIVAMASGVLTGTAEALRAVLPRLRAGEQTFTDTQTKALEALRTILTDLGASETERELVLARAHVMKIDVEEESEAYAARGILLLDGHVVAKGAGPSAWAALMAIAGHAARWRIGHEIKGWLNELRKREIPLTADAEASRAAHLEAGHHTLKRFKAKLIERGRHLDLTGLGAIVPPIPLAEVDAAIEVFDPNEGERHGRDLLWALRRRGRVLLTGLPGGGKSVAMASTAAEWAARPSWTTPILVSLRPLAERQASRPRPLRERLLDLAVADAAAADQQLLRDALDRALQDGGAILFLDGLDEAADRSLPLTKEIGDLLREIHEDTDVVVATRDNAYAAAHTLLDFADLRLGSPRTPSRAVEAVLTAIAEARHLDGKTSWIEKRREWVDRVLASDHQLSETPLLPILLTLLAAEMDTDELPETRATILQRVVDDVVRRHEIQRDSTFSALPPGQEPDALLDAFPVIARALSDASGTLGRAELAEVVAARLESRWGLPPGPAGATAREILVFWDESGIFVARGQKHLTSPRLQLLLEIGAALDAASRPEEAATFVAASASDPAQREMLILAAGLAPEIAEAFAVQAVTAKNVEISLAACRAHRQGAVISERGIAALAESLMSAINAPDRSSWRAAKAALGLSLPDALQEKAIAALESLPTEHQKVGCAIGALSWGWTGTKRDDALEAGLRVQELPLLSHGDESDTTRGSLAWATVDDALMYVKERGAADLLPHRPDLAPVVAAAMPHVSSATAEELGRVLERCGHGEVARRAFDVLYKSARDFDFVRTFADFNEEIDDVVAAIAGLAEPCELSTVEARRLPTLAAFLEAIDYNHSGRWHRGSRIAELRPRWYRLIAQLAGLDLGRLAAEARVLQAEMPSDDHDALFSLLGITAVEPTRWDRVDDAAAGASLAIAMLAGPASTPSVAALALASHPERASTAAKIAEMLPRLRRDRKRPAVYAYIKLTDDHEATANELASSEDEAIKAALAALYRIVDDGRPTSLGERLALDKAREVQLGALEQFAKIASPSNELITLVEHVAADEPRPFICLHCGKSNEANRGSCEACNVVTERPPTKARVLLEKWRSEQM